MNLRNLARVACLLVLGGIWASPLPAMDQSPELSTKTDEAPPPVEHEHDESASTVAEVVEDAEEDSKAEMSEGEDEEEDKDLAKSSEPEEEAGEDGSETAAEAEGDPEAVDTTVETAERALDDGQQASTDEDAKVASSDDPSPMTEAVDHETSEFVAEPAPEDGLSELSLEDLLSMDVFEADQIVTTSARVAVEAAQSPSMVTVISRTAIQARGYRSVGEALQSVPGLFVFNDLVTHNIAIRGVWGGPDSWSQLVKVLVDGQAVTFYNTGGSLMGPELIPMDAVEAIEVVRGPGSALYGANAFLGVVNIVTRDPEEGRLQVGLDIGAVRDRPSGNVSILGSSASTDGSSGLMVAASAGYEDRSGLGAPAVSPAVSQYEGVESQGDLSRPQSALLRGVWGVPEDGQFRLMLLHQHLDSFASFSPAGSLTDNTRLSLSNTVMRADYRRLPSGPVGLFQQVFVAYTMGKSLPQQHFDTRDPSFTLERQRHTMAAEAGIEAGYAWGANSVLIGLAGLRLEDQGDEVFQVARTDSGSVLTGDRTLRGRTDGLVFHNAGVYAQGIMHPVERLGVVAGFRYDYYDVWGDAINGRAALVFSASDTLTLRLMYGSSFVPPAPAQLEAVPLRLGGVRGNPNLESQTAHTGEAAANYRVTEWMSLSLNSFVTTINDRIEFVQVGGDLSARNLTSSLTLGGELGVEVLLAPYFIQANMSVQNTRMDDPSPIPSWWRLVYDPELPGGLLPPGYPPWMGNLIAGATIPTANLQASITARVVGPRKSSPSNIRYLGSTYTLEPYVTFDANVRTIDLQLMPGRTTQLSLHGTNLLNRQYAQPGTLGVDIPALGRAIYFTISQEI